MPDTLGYYDNNAEAFVEAVLDIAIDEACGELHQHGA
ncbi:hypothetical protein DET50_108136 [Marinobacter pelagius]|uniref:Uncharacterized protein n=1 Tax=Marinobacter pelagius TaxID=379482 RepID=A0A366GSR8_9GAMM|nr:hypothetical protein DET50_108136 [Marinobacter pelagius]